ncbi:MAG: hypothetical protein EXR64_00430 [Dehalococcoidia bacterium]|nr:hypothetical protein [Dehalococcoidia bacterium]
MYRKACSHSIFGDIERLLDALYPYRVPLALVALLVTAGAGWVIVRRGGHRPLLRRIGAHRRASLAVAVLVVVNGSVMRLRFTQPDTPRPFRVRPTIAGIPVPSLVGLGGALVLSAYMDRSALIVGGGALILGLALSFVLVQRDPAGARR